MDSLKNVLESTGMPAQRGVYTGKDKPDAYITYLRMLKGAALNADDEESSGRELYRVTLICKRNFEAHLAEVLEALKAAAGYYINSVDEESYETETGYWIVPITIEILKE